MHGNMFLIGHTGSLELLKLVRDSALCRTVVLKSCNPRAEADHVVCDNHVPVAGITEHLFQEHPFAIFAWYCMHVETRAMSDKCWMSDWLANDVIGMGIDMRIPQRPRYFGRDITSRHICVFDLSWRVIVPGH